MRIQTCTLRYQSDLLQNLIQCKHEGCPGRWSASSSRHVRAGPATWETAPALSDKGVIATQLAAPGSCHPSPFWRSVLGTDSTDAGAVRRQVRSVSNACAVRAATKGPQRH